MEEKIINKLFKLAKKSYKNNEFPVAAIIYQNGKIISCGYNKRNKSKKTTDHAEIIAIEKANAKLKSWRLTNTCMVVTLEPCEMCKRVIKEARIDDVYYIVPRLKHKKQYKCTHFKYIEINNPEKNEYINSLKTFFLNKR